jgi:hypothetical protein
MFGLIAHGTCDSSTENVPRGTTPAHGEIVRACLSRGLDQKRRCSSQEVVSEGRSGANWEGGQDLFHVEQVPQELGLRDSMSVFER